MEKKKSIASGTVSFTATTEYVKPKVYCEDCKFYILPNECRQTKITVSTPLREEINYLMCSRSNKDNNCPHFRRKWWKSVGIFLRKLFF